MDKASPNEEPLSPMARLLKQPYTPQSKKNFPKKLTSLQKKKRATSLLVSSNKLTTKEASLESRMMQLLFTKKLKTENDAKSFPGNMEKTTS
jgi:hypothetical protein